MGPGDVLREKYQLVESIGKGGMGEVFRAIHLESGSDVAIKVVSRVLLDDVLIARLEREALAAGRISSDYVPHVLEIDRTDDGELFLVMQLLFGESLSQRLRGGDPTSRGKTRSWSETTCCAGSSTRMPRASCIEI